MRISRPSLRLIGAALLCALIFPLSASASVDDDLKTMQELESAARQKSLALLAVLKNMGPEFEEGTATVAMARIVSVSCEVREARGLDSRVILNPNLNDEFRVLDQDDSLVKLALGDGRTGWLDESHLQRFEQETAGDQLNFYGVDSNQLRRYAVVTDELLAGIDDDRDLADELVSEYEAQDGPELDPLRESHAKIVEYQTYAQHFHTKYILGYDFSLQNKKAFLDNLTLWGDLLLGKSKFTTTTFLSDLNGVVNEDVNEVDGDLQQISIGGNLDINDRSKARASFSNKKEVNQTAYTTNTAMAGYSQDISEATRVDLSADTYAFADEVNAINDFRRTTLRASSEFDKPGKTYRLGYAHVSQAFEEFDTDDFTSNGLNASARWKRGPATTLQGKVTALFESSDVSFHNFSHITPSLEHTRRTGAGQVRWRGLYEMLDYEEAPLRSFGRAQVSYNKSYKDGPRRNLSSYSLSHKNFPDNSLATYIQLKAAWNRNRLGAESHRNSLSTYTNVYPDRSDNNYTDVRASRNKTTESTFRNVNLYTRLWHKPGENDSTSVAKPYVVDLFGKFGWKKGNLRFGPTVGLHAVVTKDDFELEADGNLVRVGGFVEGSYEFAHEFRVQVDASYDYGFVYSDEFSTNTTGIITAGDTVQRHPTTFQINAFGSKPLGKNFDLTSRLTVYRIATDMDPEISINPVTNNDRFTLFVGLRFRHN
jgi:hypothetical protein